MDDNLSTPCWVAFLSSGVRQARQDVRLQDDGHAQVRLLEDPLDGLSPLERADSASSLLQLEGVVVYRGRADSVESDTARRAGSVLSRAVSDVVFVYLIAGAAYLRGWCCVMPRVIFCA